MKAIKIVVCCLLLSTTTAFSQYYNDYNSNRLGGPRDSSGRTYSAPKEPTPAEIEKARTERVEKIVNTLKEELKLDDLQVVIIRNELTTNAKNMEIVMKKEDPEVDKSKELKALMDKTDVVIKSYLNKEQKEKYDILIEQLKTNTKPKKDKKKGKEKATEE